MYRATLKTPNLLVKKCSSSYKECYFISKYSHLHISSLLQVPRIFGINSKPLCGVRLELGVGSLPNPIAWYWIFETSNPGPALTANQPRVGNQVKKNIHAHQSNWMFALEYNLLQFREIRLFFEKREVKEKIQDPRSKISCLTR